MRRADLGILALSGLALLLVLLTTSVLGLTTLSLRDNASSKTQSLAPANLHLLVPASQKDANLCKMMLSAGVLGYPSPVILNWQMQLDPKIQVDGGSHLAKISGAHAYVSGLSLEHDDDLVMMVDGLDVWMQLRPQVLVDRYFKILRRANERIHRDLGKVAEEHHIRQEIVIGAQKRCWPWSFNDPACYAAPSSTLPSNIYGALTDTYHNHNENPYIRFRPRYLNSGLVIGPVRALRKLFEQALKQMKTEPNIGSDQYIFSHIFGDQQIYRETLRNASQESVRRLRADAQVDPPSKATILRHMGEVRKKAAAREDGNFEFGIGLDYESELILNTVFAEDETAWVNFSQTSVLDHLKHAINVPFRRQRSDELSLDIASSLPPFWSYAAERLPRATTWHEVPLFTDVQTGMTPSVIHHNAHRNGMKSLRQTMWNQTWFHDHARTLFDAFIYAPIAPLAVSGYDRVREWWPFEFAKGGGRDAMPSADAHWLDFDDICKDFHEEVFRDGLGPWILPENH